MKTSVPAIVGLAFAAALGAVVLFLTMGNAGGKVPGPAQLQVI